MHHWLSRVAIALPCSGFLEHGSRNRPLAIHDLRLRETITCGHVERPGGNLEAILVAVFTLHLEAEGEGTVLILDGGRIVKASTGTSLTVRE
jgi:hypothetical protein